MKLEYSTQVAGKKYVMRAHRVRWEAHVMWIVRQGRRRVAILPWDFGVANQITMDDTDWKATDRLEDAGRKSMDRSSAQDVEAARRRALARHS